MDLKEYQEWVRLTARYPSSGTGSLTYVVGTLVSEAGECQGDVTKAQRLCHGLDVSVADMHPSVQDNFIGEASDVLWAISALCNELGISLEDLADVNVAKLEAKERAGTLYATTYGGESCTESDPVRPSGNVLPATPPDPLSGEGLRIGMGGEGEGGTDHGETAGRP